MCQINQLSNQAINEDRLRAGGDFGPFLSDVESLKFFACAVQQFCPDGAVAICF